MISWEKGIEKYIDHLKAKGQAHRTVKEIPYTLNQLKAFCLNRSIYDPDFVKEQDILDFAKKQMLLIKASTLNIKIIHIKQFFAFLAKEKMIIYDVSVNIRPPKAPKPLPRQIPTPKEYVKLVSVIDTDTIHGFVYRTIIELLYATGMRIEELIHLKLSDIDLEQAKIHLYQSKTLKDRVVPLTEISARYIDAYLSHVRPKIIHFALTKENRDFSLLDNETVFLNIYGKQFDDRTINRKIKEYTKKADIDKKITSHCFRFAYASHLFENKADIRYICELLGHRTLSMTAKYIVVSKKALVEVVKKHHPRERGRL